MMSNNKEEKVKLVSMVPNGGSVFTGSILKVDYEKNPVEAIATNRPLNTNEDKIVFGGLFNKVKVGMFVKRVIYNDPVTIVFWSDNTKTTCKAQHGDKFNKETGLALCVLKKLVGGDQVAKLMEDWVVEESNVVDLKMLREKEREANKKSKTEVKAKETKIEEVKVDATTVAKKKSTSKKAVV